MVELRYVILNALQVGYYTGSTIWADMRWIITSSPAKIRSAFNIIYITKQKEIP